MSPDRNSSERINRFGLILWAGLITVGLSLYFLNPETFDPRYLRRYFEGHLITGLAIYFTLSTLRGFTLIPSTPLVLAGILVFPPWPLFLVNLLSVYSSSAIVYYMARFVRFDRFFQTNYEQQTIRLMALLHRRELPVITAWSFAPMVPTDMIIYVCSILRISAVKTLAGVSVGEGVICAIYIFGGTLGLRVFPGFS